MNDKLKEALQSKYAENSRITAWFAEKRSSELLLEIPFRDGILFRAFIDNLDAFSSENSALFDVGDFDNVVLAARGLSEVFMACIIREFTFKYIRGVPFNDEANKDMVGIAADLRLIKATAQAMTVAFNPDSTKDNIKEAYINMGRAIAESGTYWTGGADEDIDSYLITHMDIFKDERDENEPFDCRCKDIIKRIFSNNDNIIEFAELVTNFEDDEEWIKNLKHEMYPKLI